MKAPTPDPRSFRPVPQAIRRFVHGIVGTTLLALPTPALPQEPPDTTPDLRREGLPLAPGRTISTSFNEGSWISVDVSPDGQTLVFDFLGDLYTMPITGGTATPLTQGMAFDGQPRFSPDGTRVVFTSDRSGGEGVHIISLDMSDTVQLTRGKSSAYQSPEWTPDGDYVIATRQGPGQGKLWMYHVDGGSGIQLIDEPASLRTTGAAFGADDRYIWYAQRSGTWEYNSGMRQYQLAVYDRDTGESATRSFRYGGAFRPVLSPDGRWLVYGSRHVAETGLRIRDLESGDERWLVFPVQRDDQESRATRDAYPGMSFTPDSREVIAYWGGGIWRVPVDGSEPTPIPFRVDVEMAIGPEVDFDYPIEDTPTFVAKQVRDAVPSPSGDRIAFSLMARVYVMQWPDGTPTRLTEEEINEHMPAWSPDGERIAYTTWGDDVGGHIYSVDADGGDPERLTTAPALYNNPIWSPDGERIVAIRGPARAYDEALTRGVPGGADDLVWIPSDGGDATVISPARYTTHHFTRNPEPDLRLQLRRRPRLVPLGRHRREAARARRGRRGTRFERARHRLARDDGPTGRPGARPGLQPPLHRHRPDGGRRPPDHQRRQPRERVLPGAPAHRGGRRVPRVGPRRPHGALDHRQRAPGLQPGRRAGLRGLGGGGGPG